MFLQISNMGWRLIAKASWPEHVLVWDRLVGRDLGMHNHLGTKETGSWGLHLRGLHVKRAATHLLGEEVVVCAYAWEIQQGDRLTRLDEICVDIHHVQSFGDVATLLLKTSRCVSVDDWDCFSNLGP